MHYYCTRVLVDIKKNSEKKTEVRNSAYCPLPCFQVLWALHRSGMLDIILYITSSANEQAYYMHILEIMNYMLKEQKASELAHADLQRSQTEKIRDEAELLALRHRETNEKQQKVKKYAGTR